MTASDAAPAADVVLRGGWGDRRRFFEFAVTHEVCRPFVAADGSEIVGTGVGTVNGHAGWIGTIFVAPDRRARGLGRALTLAVIDAIEGAGCRTLVLVATDLGRPVYEKLGFEVQTEYHVFEHERRRGRAPADGGVHAFTAADLDDAVALDRLATGEDRAALLAAVIGVPGGLALRDGEGRLVGFVLRAAWGGGATIAPDPSDALRLLDRRRDRDGTSDRVRAGVMTENVEGRRLLETAGWRPTHVATRMIRGAALPWQPTAIWGQFGFATGLRAAPRAFATRWRAGTRRRRGSGPTRRQAASRRAL
jgi:GNAT superfamily N-acetyltransferase